MLPLYSLDVQVEGDLGCMFWFRMKYTHDKLVQSGGTLLYGSVQIGHSIEYSPSRLSAGDIR